jgi:hypothetical protein
MKGVIIFEADYITDGAERKFHRTMLLNLHFFAKGIPV